MAEWSLLFRVQKCSHELFQVESSNTESSDWNQWLISKYHILCWEFYTTLSSSQSLKKSAG